MVISFGDSVQAVIALMMAINLVISLKNTGKIEEVRHATNSMKDELVAVTAAKSHAEGVIAGAVQKGEEVALAAATERAEVRTDKAASVALERKE